MRKTVHIGIDPGASTGVAVQQRGAALQLHTLDFWACTELVRQHYDEYGEALLVVLEDPSLNCSLYARFDGVAGNRRTKIAQNVGANKRDAQLLLAFCARHGIATLAVAPLGKLTAAEFKRLTGLSHGSQHARDAARLILGR